MKRGVFIFVSILMVLSLLPANLFAQDETKLVISEVIKIEENEKEAKVGDNIESLGLVSEIDAKNSDGEILKIAIEKWEVKTYEKNSKILEDEVFDISGKYFLNPVLPDEYELSEELELPEIIVNVTEKENKVEEKIKVKREEYECTMDGVSYVTLEDAIAAVNVKKTKTIKLLKNVEFKKTMKISSGKNIIFDLNGFNLNIKLNGGEEQYGLVVSEKSSVDYKGAGAFNIYIENAEYAHGIYAKDKSKAVVSSINIKKTQYPIAVEAEKNANVKVRKNINCISESIEEGLAIGILADMSFVEVYGNVYVEGQKQGSGEGLELFGNAEVKVTGNLEVKTPKTNGMATGINTLYNNKVEIGGDLIVSGSECVEGVIFDGDKGSKITIGGAIKLKSYSTYVTYVEFRLGTGGKSEKDRDAKSIKKGYVQFSDKITTTYGPGPEEMSEVKNGETNYLWVRNVKSASVSSAKTNDKTSTVPTILLLFSTLSLMGLLLNKKHLS